MELDRREILLGGLSTLALTAAAAQPALAASSSGTGPGLTGPYVDLTTPRGNMITMARLVGDLDIGKQRAGWYNGYVSGVRPDEPLPP